MAERQVQVAGWKFSSVEEITCFKSITNSWGPLKMQEKDDSIMKKACELGKIGAKLS